MRKVLVCEPHPYHYEVLISSVYYFMELGYDVDLLVRDNFDPNDVFCRTPFERVKISTFSNEKDLKKYYLKETIKEYDFIFFNSLEYWRDDKKDMIMEVLGFIPESKYGIMGIIHNPEMLSSKETGLLKEGRIFALTSTTYNGYSIPLFSACYFGENVNDKDRIDNKILFVGLSNDRHLIEKTLSNNKITCDITLLGRINLLSDLLKKIVKKMVNVLARIVSGKDKYYKTGSIGGYLKMHYCISPNFSRMFDEIEKNDFIGIAMDPYDEKYSSFLKGKTTGAKQIVIGFSKPCIINSKFCESFELDDRYCITYDGNDLCSALNKIKKISLEDYYKMVNLLREEKMKAIEATKNNLNKTINYCVKNKG